MLKLILERYSKKNVKCEIFKGNSSRMSIKYKYNPKLKYKINKSFLSCVSIYIPSRSYSKEHNHENNEEEEEYQGEEIPLLQFKWDAIEEEVKDLLTKELNPSFLRIMDKTKPGGMRNYSDFIQII